MTLEVVVKAWVRSYTYPSGQTAVLSNVDIVVRRGEYVLIAGPSGGGKSTLCRCLTGLIPHFYNGDLAGTVEIFGHDIGALLPHELVPRVGMVFQNPQDQLLAVTVRDDVAFGPQQLCQAPAEIRRRVDDALAAVDAGHLSGSSVFDLSSGQQQRVALAGALALQPDLLILDEPTSQLDAAGAAAFLDAVARLHRERGTTVVIVEQHLAQVLPAVDRMIVVANGHVALDGPPREELANAAFDDLGVDVPPVVRLALDMRNAGVVFDALPLTVDEAAAAIARELDNHA